MDDIQVFDLGSPYPTVEGAFITTAELQRLIAISGIAKELVRLVDIDVLFLDENSGTPEIAYARDVLKRAKAARL